MILNTCNKCDKIYLKIVGLDKDTDQDYIATLKDYKTVHLAWAEASACRVLKLASIHESQT